jgi:C_GCAxxG_C_C family probable redox protein
MTVKSSKEDVLNRVEQKAGDYMEGGKGNCAQGAFFALREEFNLGDGMIIKSLAAMPGIGFRGETCGAVTGALAALSISSGRDKLGYPVDTDFESYLSLMKAATSFCHAFEKEFGSLMCNHIHTQLLGKTFNMADPAQIQEVLEAGGPQK